MTENEKYHKLFDTLAKIGFQVKLYYNNEKIEAGDLIIFSQRFIDKYPNSIKTFTDIQSETSVIMIYNGKLDYKIYSKINNVINIDTNINYIIEEIFFILNRNITIVDSIFLIYEIRSQGPFKLYTDHHRKGRYLLSDKLIQKIFLESIAFIEGNRDYSIVCNKFRLIEENEYSVFITALNTYCDDEKDIRLKEGTVSFLINIVPYYYYHYLPDPLQISEYQKEIQSKFLEYREADDWILFKLWYYNKLNFLVDNKSELKHNIFDI